MLVGKSRSEDEDSNSVLDRFLGPTDVIAEVIVGREDDEDDEVFVSGNREDEDADDDEEDDDELVMITRARR